MHEDAKLIFALVSLTEPEDWVFIFRQINDIISDEIEDLSDLSVALITDAVIA